TRVQTNSHRDRTRRQRLGEGRGRGERSRRGREGEEKGVPLRIYLDPALGGAGLPNHAPVLSEGVRVGLRTECVQELGRALDIGEEEGDGAGRESASHVSGLSDAS